MTASQPLSSQLIYINTEQSDFQKCICKNSSVSSENLNILKTFTIPIMVLRSWRKDSYEVAFAYFYLNTNLNAESFELCIAIITVQHNAIGIVAGSHCN